jgi:cellulose synthase/poly-beta-1,6-N-acetylglucosamine synthase-like glycosyltransferase
MIEVIIFIAASLIVYTYFLYPICLYILARMQSRSWLQSPESLPSVSIIMAVNNGAPLLRSKLKNLAALTYPPEKLEIIAVSDGSTDETELILKESVNSRFHVISYPDRLGKAEALNIAIARASSDVLFFTDVRPTCAPDALALLVSNFADSRIGCVGGELSLSESSHDVTTRGVGIYWKYEQFMRLLESKIHSTCGMYGGFYAVRRELAVSIPPGTVLDDIYQPMNVVRQGYRAVIDIRSKVWDTWPTEHNAEFKRKVRTLAGNFQLLRLCPWLLWPNFPTWAQFLSHKVLRLVMPWCLLILFSCSVLLSQQIWFGVFLVLQLVFYACAIYGASFPKSNSWALVSATTAFCSLNWAAMVGLWEYFRDPELTGIWKVTSTAHMSTAAAANTGKGAVGNVISPSDR